MRAHTKKGNTGKLIEFPNATKMDEDTLAAHVAELLNHQAVAAASKTLLFTREQLLVSLIDRVITELEITKEDILRYKELMTRGL